MANLKQGDLIQGDDGTIVEHAETAGTTQGFIPEFKNKLIYLKSPNSKIAYGFQLTLITGEEFELNHQLINK